MLAVKNVQQHLRSMELVVRQNHHDLHTGVRNVMARFGEMEATMASTVAARGATPEGALQLSGAAQGAQQQQQQQQPKCSVVLTAM